MYCGALGCAYRVEFQCCDFIVRSGDTSVDSQTQAQIEGKGATTIQPYTVFSLLWWPVDIMRAGSPRRCCPKGVTHPPTHFSARMSPRCRRVGVTFTTTFLWLPESKSSLEISYLPQLWSSLGFRRSPTGITRLSAWRNARFCDGPQRAEVEGTRRHSSQLTGRDGEADLPRVTGT